MMTEHQRDTLGMLRLALKSAEGEPVPDPAPAGFRPLHAAVIVQRNLIPHWANIETLQGIPDEADSAAVVLTLARLLKHMPKGSAELRSMLMTLADYAPGANYPQEDLRYPIDTFEDVPLLLLKFFEIRALSNPVERQWTMEALQRTRDPKIIVKASMLLDIYDKKTPKVYSQDFLSAMVPGGSAIVVPSAAMAQAPTKGVAVHLPLAPFYVVVAGAGVGGVAFPNGGGYNPPMSAAAMNSADVPLVDMPEDFDELTNTIASSERIRRKPSFFR